MRIFRLLALCLAMMFLLTGCLLTDIINYAIYSNEPQETFDDITYTRPDLEAFRQSLDSVLEAAETGESFLDVATSIMSFDSLYRDYLTNYYLAEIYYYRDLTDTHWEAEYNFCLQSAPSVEQSMEELYHALARSQYREELETDDYFGEGFFDAYDGDMLYDEHFLALSEQEAALESRYYDLCDRSSQMDPYSEEFYSSYGMEMAQLLAEMIALRQEMADYAGYESYAAYAYETYYARDYTPRQAEDYLAAMGQALTPVMEECYQLDDWGFTYDYCTTSAVFSYTQSAAYAMGGVISEAFDYLDVLKLHDIRYGKNKYNASFEIFLPSYGAPFIFMNPNMDMTDKLTFSHEFGHFANDYACGGSYAGIDVAEVHSQAFEYLSLCYGQPDENLANYKTVDSLFLYIQCAANALFELRAYQLTGEQLTAENIIALYEDIGSSFGFEHWGLSGMDFVQTTHFYTNPMYVVSYVVSNDLATQIYQQELAQPGAGLELYTQCLYSQESGIVAFAEEYGLESPFGTQRPQSIAGFFRDALARIKPAAAAAA